jgi:hypothetical protein
MQGVELEPGVDPVRGAESGVEGRRARAGRRLGVQVLDRQTDGAGPEQGFQHRVHGPLSAVTLN